MVRSPRHLAEPPKRFGLSHLQLVFLIALVTLAVVTAAIGLAARDGGPPEAAPASTKAQATSTTPASTTAAGTTTVTTVPAARPIRPTPGNLLPDGDFERDLAGWTALGDAGVERVQGGTSGRWAVAVAPGGSGDGSPGLGRSGTTTTRAGTTYEAIFWVRAAAGRQVLLALRERAGDQVVSSDEAGYTLPDANWQQVAVEHRTQVPGSSLALEILGLNLPPGDRLLVDAVDLQVE
jgi:carbohydrate binding protein with CBM4/9 domain